MSSTVSYRDFDIARRWDGLYNIWDYAWWPDDYLDADPAALDRWLQGTHGWRAKGWQVVHVARTPHEARTWINSILKAPSNNEA